VSVCCVCCLLCVVVCATDVHLCGKGPRRRRTSNTKRNNKYLTAPMACLYTAVCVSRLKTRMPSLVPAAMQLASWLNARCSRPARWLPLHDSDAMVFLVRARRAAVAATAARVAGGKRVWLATRTARLPSDDDTLWLRLRGRVV
jgi:hypothetical protein